METLAVDLNRDGPHTIDVAPAFHADGPFEIVLDNHGSALHVYLQLDEDLARAVDLGAVNHFVQEESLRRVAVDVDPAAAPVRGRLKVVTGYGSQTEFVTLTIEEVDEGAGGVDVDESLARPPPRAVPDASSGPLDLEEVPVVALGVLAVVVAVLAALAAGGGLPFVALLVVLVGLGIGAVLLSR